ncbi:TRAP transporter small permease [Acidaminococcus timonensis]|mgnify:CR=1 FL=1|uniref:TRAP transporter small permease n=1 Tax=Acidaminococcus timonensis TaxID=1871002 RepID=UPI003081018D
MFKKIAHGYLKIVEGICITLLFIIFLLMVIQVVCRLLTIGQNFTEELARICFCLMIFLGAPLTLAEGADICVDMLVNKLPIKFQKGINVLINILTCVFSVFCIKSMTVLIQTNVGVSAVAIPWIKMNWIYTAMTIGFGFLFIVAVCKAIATLKGAPDTMDINAEEKALARKKESEMNLGI